MLSSVLPHDRAAEGTGTLFRSYQRTRAVGSFMTRRHLVDENITE